MRLYDMPDSGNCYKVRLLLAHLDLDYERVEVDVHGGQTRTPEFVAMNPNARVPVLEIESGTVLAESNAILFYLAEGTRYLPEGRLDRARALQWMFFEQYSHEPYVAVARSIVLHLSEDHPRRERLPELREKGQAGLAVMEHHLLDHDFFVGGAYSVADIALYAYTHVAPEGGYDLARFPAIRRWIERVRQQPGHVPIGATCASR